MIGVSAGSILLTPHIGSAELCGDVNDVGLADLAGLGVVPFLLVPHARDIADLVAKVRTPSDQHALPAIALADDQAVFVTESEIQVAGGAMLFRDGAVTALEDGHVMDSAELTARAAAR